MVEEKQNEPTTEKELKEEILKQGQNKKSKKSVAIVAILTTILVVVVAGLGSLWYLNKDVLARIGDTKITKKDLNKAIYSENFIGSADNPTKVSAEREKEIINELVETAIVKNQAEKDGISISEEELNEAIQSRGMNSSNYTQEQQEIAKENIKNELLKEKFEEQMFGWKSGDYVLFRFDKYLSNIASKEGQNKDKLVEEQKSYAKNLADSYYNKLKNKEISMNDAAFAVSSDPVIGASALEPYKPNLSGSFGKEDYLQESGYFDTKSYPNFKDKVNAIKKGTVAEPVLLQDLSENKVRDIAYALVVVKEENTGKYQTGFSTWLTQQKDDLKVKTYTTKDPFYKKVSLINKAFAVSCSADSSTKQTVNSGELTPVNIYLKYKKADGTLGDITTSMGVSFDFKSRVNKVGGYDNSQHSFIRVSGADVGRTFRNLCNVPVTSNGFLRLESSNGQVYKINCGYVKYVDVYYNDPKISNDAGNGAWDIKDSADSGQSDKRWIDFDQGASDGKITIRTFCYLHKNGTCNSDSSGGTIHYPNGDKINFQMIYTPSYIKPSCNIVANPTSINNGSSATVTWTTANASSFKINNISKPLNGSMSTGNLTGSVTYVGTATGDGGSGSCQTTVNVNALTTYYWCPVGKYAPTACSFGQYASDTACSSANGGVSCSTSSSCTCPIPTVSCTFKPKSGELPLVTSLDISSRGAIAPYAVRITKDGGFFSNFSTNKTSNTVSLKAVGQYKAYVKASNTAEALCEPAVTVKSPNSSTGGEVAP